MTDRKPSKAFLNRFYAYTFARMTYRDTDLLESHHVVSGQLDADFYSQMLSEVQNNFDKLLPQIRRVIDGPAPQSEEEKNLFIWLNGLLHSMDQWLPPKRVRDSFNGSVAEFVLSGEFLSACTQGLKLNDELMMKLNIDVHNRFYTLVCRGVME